MKLSTDRILTTHVGSLPRPQPLVDLMVKRDHGQSYDAAEMKRMVRQAVADLVERQVKIGIDIVSDGEASKIGYATYVKERLSGFRDENFSPQPQRDLADFPELRERMVRFIGGRPLYRRFCCTGAIKVRDPDAAREDIANFRSAIARFKPAEAFMTAASPGVVTVFHPNRYYKSHEAYAEAVGAAMREEYEAIAGAGLVLQVDCPDLAMAGHTSFQDLTEAEFLKRAEHQVETLNHAVANIPASSMRLHLCWGNYEGPHDHDIPLRKILPIALKAKPQAISFEASNPRHGHEWTVWHEVKLPDDKVLIPGVLDTVTNFIEHPELVAQRICQFAGIVGRERVIAGTDCGFATFVGNWGRVDPEIAFRKLRAMVEGAEIASKRLWG
jgi:5-methyltetrahydropteroyltriglutamate--homocysteine methyltransferase